MTDHAPEDTIDVTTGEVIDSEIVEDAHSIATDMMPFVPQAVAARTSDLRDVATDSWTDVLGDVITLARGIAETEFVPRGLRGSVPKTSAAILYGRELGLPPMTALGSTHVIEGTAGISAEAMRALILQAGHDLQIVENSSSRCVIRGRRRGSDAWTEAVATKAEYDAKFMRTKAGVKKLTDKDNWKNYPAEMLLARATTRLSRMIFPDVIHGMRSAEELQDMTSDVSAVGAVVVEAAVAAPAPERARVQRKPRPAPKPEPALEQSMEADLEPAVTPPAPAPERVRKAPPAPKPTPALEPGSGDPEPSTPATAEIIQEDDPAAQGQLGVIHSHMRRLGVDDREERLFWTATLAGLEPTALTSSSELTNGQASQVIGKLGKCRDKAALDALDGGRS